MRSERPGATEKEAGISLRPKMATRRRATAKFMVSSGSMVKLVTITDTAQDRARVQGMAMGSATAKALASRLGAGSRIRKNGNNNKQANMAPKTHTGTQGRAPTVILMLPIRDQVATRCKPGRSSTLLGTTLSLAKASCWASTPARSVTQRS